MSKMKIGLSLLLAGFVVNTYAAVATNWVADPGFEGLATNTEPETNSTPWYAIEDQDNRVIRELGIVNSGAQAVQFVAFKKGQVAQVLPSGFTVDSNATYEVSFYVQFAEPSPNTDVTRLTCAIDTTTNGVYGSDYVVAKSFFNNNPTTTNEWQKFTLSFTGAEIADRHGEYFQLRFNKTSNTTVYNVFLDDVEFGFYEQVIVDPDPIAVVSNYLADPGFEALAGVNDPSSNSAPWFAVEPSDTDLRRSTEYVVEGNYAVDFNAFKAETLLQNVTFTPDVEALYAIRFDMLLADFAPLYSNDLATVTAQLLSSTNAAGPYTTITNAGGNNKVIFYGLTPSTTNAWEQQLVVFNGSDLSQVTNNTHFQLSLKSAKSQYSVWIDNVELGEYAGLPASQAPTAPANLLIGWYESVLTNDYAVSGIDGIVFTNALWKMDATRGSDDGSYGSIDGAATQPILGYGVRQGNASNGIPQTVVQFSITNNSANAVYLDSISFDFGRQALNAPSDFELNYVSGDLADLDGTLINSETNTPALGHAGDLLDYDWSLAPLGDRYLEPGEHAIFALVATNWSGAFNTSVFDNIGIFTAVTDSDYLIGWHTPDAGTGAINDSTPNEAKPGITGLISGGKETFSPFPNSDDDAYGKLPITDAGAPTGNSIKLQVNNNTQRRLDISISNNTGGDIELTSLNFDFNRANTNDSPQDMDVTYLSGDLAIAGNPSIFSFTGNTGDVGYSTFTDVDASLIGLDDNVLADGESATFRIEVDNGVAGAALRIDNIAINGRVPVSDSDYLIGWHSPDDAGSKNAVYDTTPDEAKAGISGSIIGGREVNTTGTGSSDGTYGNLTITDTNAVVNAILLRINNGPQSRLDISVRNNTGGDVTLESLNFDYNRANTNDSPTEMDVTYLSGDLAIVGNPSVFSYTGNTGDVGFNNGNYTDVDASLTGLADNVLADGESATFRIQVAGGLVDNVVRIDNIAFDGTAGGYAGWAASYSLVQGALGDDDADGLINIYEYGLGGIPNNGTIAPAVLPAYQLVGSTLEIIHVQRTDDPALAYYLELTTNLVTGVWTNTGYTVTGTTPLAAPFEEVTNSVPVDVPEKFIQLIIE